MYSNGSKNLTNKTVQFRLSDHTLDQEKSVLNSELVFITKPNYIEMCGLGPKIDGFNSRVMEKIWDRKSFEVAGHWPLWWDEKLNDHVEPTKV